MAVPLAREMRCSPESEVYAPQIVDCLGRYLLKFIHTSLKLLFCKSKTDIREGVELGEGGTNRHAFSFSLSTIAQAIKAAWFSASTEVAMRIVRLKMSLVKVLSMARKNRQC